MDERLNCIFNIYSFDIEIAPDIDISLLKIKLYLHYLSTPFLSDFKSLHHIDIENKPQTVVKTDIFLRPTIHRIKLARMVRQDSTKSLAFLKPRNQPVEYYL